ncbi:MAG: hypothetical protein WAK31_14860 [Chthoniobacterales bacterium]
MIPGRIILSRKGFDANLGRRASPIFDDETMVSIPIPEGPNSPEGPNLRVKYDDIVDKDGHSLGPLVESLTGKQIHGCDGVHLDPDLTEAAIQRRNPVGWLPSLGHTAGAQTHLANNDVGEGDLFLFFGWFRRVRNVAGKWRYIPGSPDLQVLFGWLQIGEILTVDGSPSAIIKEYPWLEYHPHLSISYARWRGYENNTIYVAREWMSLPEIEDSKIKGGGIFPRFNSSLQLTAPDQHNRTLWLLPDSFRPKDKHTMTYHSNEMRWKPCGAGYHLQTVGRGQEFILKTKDYPGIISWTGSLFKAL